MDAKREPDDASAPARPVLRLVPPLPPQTMAEMTAGLVLEYAGLVPADEVIESVAVWRDELLEVGIRDDELVGITEAAVRQFLDILAPDYAACRTSRPVSLVASGD